MPQEKINQLVSEGWVKKELHKLRGETIIVTVAVFAAVGIILGSYLFNDYLTLPIKNVRYEMLDENKISVMWDSRLPMKSKIEYGTGKIYLNNTEFSKEYATKHSVYVSGLLPDKPHYFRIVAEDSHGQRYVTPFYIASR